MTDSGINAPLLMEQIKGVIQRQAELAKQLENLSDKLASTYVQQGTYAANRESDERRFRELEKDNENSAGFRRQVAAGFIVGFLLILLPLLGTVTSAIGAK